MNGELLAFHLSNFVSFSMLEAANMMLRVNDETGQTESVSHFVCRVCFLSWSGCSCVSE
jgi:hypothetical protein